MSQQNLGRDAAVKKLGLVGLLLASAVESNVQSRYP